jgi:transcriptional regulator with XRE-family HTH domain
MNTKSVAQILRAKIVGALIRDARLTTNKSVAECAQAIGVSPEQFERYELGEIAPSLPEIEGIAYYLNIPMDHFWETQALTPTEGPKNLSKMTQVIRLRHRVIGALLRQARLDGRLSIEDLARRSEINAEKLEAYELGMEAIPLPQLETLSSLLNRSIREFLDYHGPVGVWITQQRALQDFLTMPSNLQTFVSKPVNRPYLELAIRLSEMSVDRLRTIAEGLLEITY